MKHSEYQKLIHLAYTDGNLVPACDLNHLYNELQEGELTSWKRVSARDLKFHRAYFAFLTYVYKYMPNSFQKKVAQRIFYQWLQHLKGEYKVLFEFKYGVKMIEYESISFTNMDEAKFKIYIKEQIPFIYSDVIMAVYDDNTSNTIIENIEQEFEKFFAKLFKI